MVPFYLFSSLLLLVPRAALSAPVVQLDVWGADSVRVRIAPPGGAIVDPPFGALLVPHPAQSAHPESSPLSVSSGNLVVTADPNTGFINASRVNDGALLFTTAAIAFGAPAPGSRPGSVSASIVLLPSASTGTNKIYGLGEHRTGTLDMTGYAKLLRFPVLRGKSRGRHHAPFLHGLPSQCGAPVESAIIRCCGSRPLARPQLDLLRDTQHRFLDNNDASACSSCSSCVCALSVRRPRRVVAPCTHALALR